MSVRARRLQADYEQIKQGLRNHPAVSVRGVSGTPPDRYQIEFKVRSLVEHADGTISERHEHVAEIYLTLAYPKQAPQCRMLTPVFHPNIAPHAICVGDHWAAGESLLALIVRIGEMLAYQSYNPKSPLNGAAARWAEEHGDLLPTDPRDLSPSVWAGAEHEAPAEGQCQNCHAGDRPLRTCSRGHEVCADCLLACPRCGRTFCLLCQLDTCAVCGRVICADCRSTCPQCGRVVCSVHLTTCAMCGTPGCPDCSIACSVCGRTVCLEHVTQCATCRAVLCAHDASRCASCERPLCREHVLVCTQCGRGFCEEHVDVETGLCPSCRPDAGTTQ